MEYACVILRYRLESDAEGLVDVRAVDPDQFSAGLIMLQLVERATEHRDLNCILDGKPGELVSDGKCHPDSSNRILYRV